MQRKAVGWLLLRRVGSSLHGSALFDLAIPPCAWFDNSSFGEHSASLDPLICYENATVDKVVLNTDPFVVWLNFRMPSLFR